jgi:Bacterial regulatory proteins, tetR family
MLTLQGMIPKKIAQGIVTKQASIGAGTLYRYFPSQEQLLF